MIHANNQIYNNQAPNNAFPLIVRSVALLSIQAQTDASAVSSCRLLTQSTATQSCFCAH